MTELQPTASEAPVDRAVETIHDRAHEVRGKETARAMRRLRARRSLDPAEVEQIRTLAARLTARLVAAPTAGLQHGDTSRAAVAMDIFGREE